MNILKECYLLSEKNVKSEVAKDLIHSRLVSSEKIKSKNPIDEKPFSNEEIFNNVLLALSDEAIDSTSNDVFPKLAEVNAMMESAEKNYILALLALRSGMNDKGRIAAIDYLIKAHDDSPNDPRIRTLMLILQSL